MPPAREGTPMNELAALKAALDEHAIVAITDSEGRITFVNDRFCAIAKYSREELIGRDHRIINSGYHPREFFGTLWATITAGEVWRGEFRNRAKDGSLFWVATTIVPLPDEHGKPREFIAMHADVTEQKRVKAALEEKLRLQGLLASISTLLIGVPSNQVDAAIEQTQRVIVETLGLDRCTLWQRAEEGPGMVLAHCYQRPGWRPLPVGYSTEGNLPWAFDTVMRGEPFCFTTLADLPPEAARDVETFRKFGPVSNLTIPLIANERVIGALAFATLGAARIWREDEVLELKLIAQIIGNVFGRQRAELHEEQLRDELSHAMRVATLGELIAALAHELNQPLAAILSNAQAARRFIAASEPDLEEIRAILDDIVRDDKRAGAVIRNVRAMVSKRPADRESCCLDDLVEEVIELMGSEFIEHKIEVRTTLKAGSARVHAARVELQQVLLNLLVNAIHAMEQTPLAQRAIEVETQAGADVVSLSVRDHGHGIPPEQLATVFHPFFSTKATGLGIGLSICRRIIENHAGVIEARNGEDSGAHFSFSLPVGRASDAAD
jgi:PAS domain S-box-containing protein